uniref:Uncharacterized protein n=1 Tax=Arundo donax TaxID=35708 RepID=A0A0A8XYY5_ARUDO
MLRQVKFFPNAIHCYPLLLSLTSLHLPPPVPIHIQKHSYMPQAESKMESSQPTPATLC